MRHLAFTAWLILAATGTASAQDAGVEFFETKIRPVLIEHCYKCHSHQAKKHRGDLYVDSRDGLRKGGETGPAVVPGKPAASLLLKAVQHAAGDLKMPPPPADKLAAAVIADLKTWIAMGAPDLRDTAGTKSGGIDFGVAGRHWAYQPLRTPILPPVKDSAWAAAPIDRFILAKLEAHGLTPSPRADRRTLIRRAYYDLIGLPPTAAEVEAFVDDASCVAYEQVVDRLLASPHYGERWGRHWLDVARYADTKDGVLMFGDDRVRPYAYTYRDYVIKALNADTPFDRFVEEQLAADQIEPRVEPWRLAAMGYLTLGRMFDNNVHDVIDDRIDVVTRGLLGLTVACARCHDHKYDPIPQMDYYSLYGVFASSEAPLELPLIDRPEGLPGFAEFEKKAAPKRAELQKLLDAQFALLSEQARRRTGDYLARAATTDPDPLETAIFFLSLAPNDLRPQIVARWRRFLASPNRADDPVFGPWQDFMNVPAGDYTDQAKAVVERWRMKPTGLAKGQLNPLLHDAFGNVKLAGKADVARLYGDLLIRAYDEVKKTPMPQWQQLADAVAGKNTPAYFPRSQTYYYMLRGEKDAYGGMLSQYDKLAVQSPSALPRAMVLYDASEMHDPRVFVRGNAGVPGDRVPRQFLRILAGTAPAVCARQRPARTGPRHRRHAAGRPCAGQSRVDAPLRRAAGGDSQRLRQPQHAAGARGTARLSRVVAQGGGWLAQEAAPPDHAVERLSAGEPRPPGVRRGRPGQQGALALSAAPARFRGDARYAAGGRGPARPEDARPAGRRGWRREQSAANRLRVGRSPKPTGPVSRVRFRQSRPVRGAPADDDGAAAGVVWPERAIHDRAGQGARRPP